MQVLTFSAEMVATSLWLTTLSNLFWTAITVECDKSDGIFDMSNLGFVDRTLFEVACNP